MNPLVYTKCTQNLSRVIGPGSYIEGQQLTQNQRFIMSYKCETPILLLVFNRPDVTSQVFEAIRAAKPTNLYVASDGARASLVTPPNDTKDDEMDGSYAKEHGVHPLGDGEAMPPVVPRPLQ